MVERQFFPSLMAFNLFMAAFNMLPAFPMDGGRVLRAFLALRLPYARATRLAASIGQFMAILFGLTGLAIQNPFLLLIALFVWIGAEAEAARVEERFLLKDARVRDAMLTEFHTLAPSDTLGYAADLLLAGTQQDFPVRTPGDHSFMGVLRRSDMLDGLSRAGRDAAVAGYMKAETSSVEAESPLNSAVALLREGGKPCLEVVDHGETVGLLTLENIGEFLMVRTALAERSSGSEVGAKPRLVPTVPAGR
jgi:hypothetical protein